MIVLLQKRRWWKHTKNPSKRNNQKDTLILNISCYSYLCVVEVLNWARQRDLALLFQIIHRWPNSKSYRADLNSTKILADRGSTKSRLTGSSTTPCCRSMLTFKSHRLFKIMHKIIYALYTMNIEQLQHSSRSECCNYRIDSTAGNENFSMANVEKDNASEWVRLTREIFNSKRKLFYFLLLVNETLTIVFVIYFWLKWQWIW